jgi:hypothetical protein
MDWFEELFGFREDGYAGVRKHLKLDGQVLHSSANGRSFGVGDLELVSLQTLRDRVKPRMRGVPALAGELKCSIVRGDVRKMHLAPEYEGALFQVASQFNLLEMPSYGVTPEAGITDYAYDRTQGPACALAAAAATLYRNYFVPVGKQRGQTRELQLDGLADLGAVLIERLGMPLESLWSMTNGYALCTKEGLAAISGLLAGLDGEQVNGLRGHLKIGLHRNVEVTDSDPGSKVFVSQVFCSALPVAYTRLPDQDWAAFASLVLESAYEATMLAAAEAVMAGGSNIVLLTSLGGGAFGNRDEWIHAAMSRALAAMAEFNLDVRVVSYRAPSSELVEMVQGVTK